MHYDYWMSIEQNKDLSVYMALVMWIATSWLLMYPNRLDIEVSIAKHAVASTTILPLHQRCTERSI